MGSVHGLSDLFSVLLPKRCLACDTRYTEQIVCVYCLQDLQCTNFASLKANALMQIFEGRVTLESTVSLLYFEKGSLEQHLLHKLKYKGYRILGIFFADYLCGVYPPSSWGGGVDVVIPIPLDASRKRHRGYNQVSDFAQRLTKHLNANYEDKILLKPQKLETQTFKSNWDRWSFGRNNFQMAEDVSLKGKHILLVDDLVTTGNTIQEAHTALSEEKDVRISLATIAMAR